VIGDRRGRVAGRPKFALLHRIAHERLSGIDIARGFDQTVGIEHEERPVFELRRIRKHALRMHRAEPERQAGALECDDLPGRPAEERRRVTGRCMR